MCLQVWIKNVKTKMSITLNLNFEPNINLYIWAVYIDLNFIIFLTIFLQHCILKRTNPNGLRSNDFVIFEMDTAPT